MHPPRCPLVGLAAAALMVLVTLTAPAAVSASPTPPQSVSPYGMDVLGLGWQWMFPRIEANPRFAGSIRVDLLDSALHQAADAGVRWNRTSTWWCYVEPERGQFFWDDLDAITQVGRNYGIETVPVLMYAPYWAVTNASGSTPCLYSTRKNYPPANMGDWENFVRALVRRYGPAGKDVIHYWEIWNEPDLPEFLSVDNDWGDGTVPVYAELLVRAARIIREEAPGSKILFGGLSDIRGSKFLDKVLALTGTQSVHQSFDIVSYHAYSVHAFKTGLIHDVLVKYGLQDRPLWDTELNYLGWNYQQAELGLPGLYQVLRSNNVERSFWYLSVTSKWGPGIFYTRDQEWLPVPFIPSPFYKTFKAQAAAFQPASAPSGVVESFPTRSRPRFAWDSSPAGSFKVAGYKLQVDSSLFLGKAYFARPAVDIWIPSEPMNAVQYLPLVMGRGGAITGPTGRPAAWVPAPGFRPSEGLSLNSPVTLGMGNHYWRIAAVDSEGNVGAYSEPRLFVVRGPYLNFVPIGGPEQR